MIGFIMIMKMQIKGLLDWFNDVESNVNGNIEIGGGNDVKYNYSVANNEFEKTINEIVIKRDDVHG